MIDRHIPFWLLLLLLWSRLNYLSLSLCLLLLLSLFSIPTYKPSRTDTTFTLIWVCVCVSISVDYITHARFPNEPHLVLILLTLSILLNVDFSVTRICILWFFFVLSKVNFIV